MAKGLRILVVADQLRARKSLRALLATCPLTAEVNEASNAKEARTYLETQGADVVVLDIQAQEMEGLAIARDIKTHWPPIKVLALSLYNDERSDALAGCADAVISKGEPPEHLLTALTTNPQR